MISANRIIENLFSDFVVDDRPVALGLLDYVGHGEDYVVYNEVHKSGAYAAENANAGYFSNVDFQVFSRGNYLHIVEELLSRLEGAGFIYEPEKDSPDLYDPDTKYFHKTLCFAYPIQRDGDGGSGEMVDPIDDVTFPLLQN